MDTYSINSSKDLSQLLQYKASVVSHQPYQLNSGFIPVIRKKVDDYLKVNFETVYDAVLNNVEQSTQDQYYDDKINSINDKLEDVRSEQSDMINKYGDDAKSYIDNTNNMITKLQDKKFYYISAKDHPNVISMYSIPKLVYMQWKKNIGSKIKVVSDTTDSFLESFLDKLSKSDLVKLSKLMAERFDDNKDLDISSPLVNDTYHPLDVNSSIPVEVVSSQNEDDFIEEIGPVRH